MLQTVMQLSLLSRTTSYSSSFQPFKLLSTMTCLLFTRAICTRRFNSATSDAKPLPSPPNAKAARTNTGKPIVQAADTASSIVVQHELSATFSPQASTALAKSSRSSVVTMARIGVPSTLTPYFAKIPSSSSLTAQFKAVWPPKVHKMPSGRSRSITCVTNSTVTGKKYTRSARPQEVCTVAMFGLIKMDVTPDSWSALIAWLPE